jgi:hypothetical protein
MFDDFSKRSHELYVHSKDHPTLTLAKPLSRRPESNSFSDLPSICTLAENWRRQDPSGDRYG